jgi:hypothetical protein
MKKIIILLFSFICLFANIGTVVDVVGHSTLVRNGQNIKVLPKLQLKEHDFIKTGKDAKVKIFFKDNTAVSLGQNTIFEIDTYLFTGKKDSKIKFKVLKGFFKTVTGKISKVAPQRFKLQTKNATIGIRGTVFAAKVGDNADVVMCTDGKIILFTPNGNIEVNSGNTAFAADSGVPKIKTYTQEEKEKLIKNAGWHGSMSMSELVEFIKKNFKEPLRSQLLEAIENIYNKDSSETRGKNTQIKNADDISFVDDITINGRDFDELPRHIEFYLDDVKDGKVIVQGLLESENKAVNVNSLHVEITTDGGETWSRASGNDEWEWSFTPELERPYEFSLRVVQEINNSDTVTSVESDDIDLNVGDTINIAGFTLNLNADVSLRDGKLSGSGKITIPYLKKISNIANEIDVGFSNLKVVNNIVTLGDITYTNPFTIDTPLASLEVDSITFSPISQNNKIVGRVNFKNTLGASFGEIELPSASKFLPTSFSLNIPFESKVIDIWKEKSVAIAISEGSLDIGYSLGDELPKAKLNIPSAQFKMGDLLRYANGLSVEVGLGDFGKMPTIELPNDVYLMDTGIKLPSGLSLGFDLNDYTNPKLTFNSSVYLEAFTNEFAKNLQNASISVTVQKTGFEATLSGDGGLDPITLLDRGSDTKSVKLIFEGDNPSFSFAINNDDSPLSVSVDGVIPKLQFGELFTNEAGQALNKIVSLGSMETPTLDISEPMYLLGSKIKLPSGFSASVDLSDLKAPILDFDIGVDFTGYDNIVAKQISGAKIKGRLSKDGFNATVTSDKPSPIDIYTPKGVKIVFKGESGPTFGVNITGTESLPEFSISDIEADLDFGTLLTSADNDMQKVIASIGVIRENGLEVLQLTLPSTVRLLQSKLKFKNIVSSLDLKTKNITIGSTVDLSDYTQNQVLKALNGANLDMSITSSSFAGVIAVDDELDPIAIWPAKNVNLTISGKPTIGVTVDSGGVGFDFGELNAAIDFGDLLKTAKNGATSVVATFAQTLNDVGNYSVQIQNDVYLLGSEFALKKPSIDFNPNIKSISFSSAVNLSSYSEPMIKAFDGASFIASVSSSGFSGSLTKEGGFEPIVVLDRGGEGKDVSVEFTSSPVISVEIKNSGLDFGFSGGSADLHFGDLLNSATVSLRSLQDGVYSWELNGKNKLYSSAKAYVEKIKNAKLDIKDFENPKIFFDATVDLSQYGGLLKSVQSADLKNVVISRAGFSASLSAHLGTIDIWKEKRVTMAFSNDPTISLDISKSGLDLGFSDISAELNFGDLLANATATIGSVMPSGSTSRLGLSKSAKESKEDAKKEITSALSSNDFSWSIDRNNIPLGSSDILMSGLSGSIDLSDLSNPSITLNAIADLRRYGNVFKYVRNAEVKDVTISREGFEGSLITSLNDIQIWREKNVKVHFNSSPEFFLKVNSSGVKVGASAIDASVYLGSLLNNSIATLSSRGNDIYDWSIAGKNKLGSSSVFLSKLQGAMDFGNLKDPKLAITSATVSGFNSPFNSVSLKSAKISKNGFDGYFSANMDDINIYTEDTKKVDLRFIDGQTPTVHMKITRSDSTIGLSDINANLVFTNILDNSTIKLLATNDDGVYKWGLTGSHNFLNDTNGVVEVSNLGGLIDINDWLNPLVTFHTTADFTNYNFSDNLNLGIADVTNAEITKTQIKWNVTLQNARANFTILEMGNGANDDVRVELRNINASANNSGGSLNGADGTLFFGKLFTGNKQIGLTYQTSEGGLKTYGFSFNEDIIYKKDDHNFVTLKSPSGELVEIANDTYKVILNGQAVARSSVLSAISIGELTASNLEVGSSGFKGDIAADFNNISYNILEGKASVSLQHVGLHIDSTKNMPISLKSFDGDLDLQYFFDENVAKAALSFVNDTSSIGWSFPVTTTLHVNQNFEFKNLSGTLNLASLDELSIGLDGKFGYKNINQDITLNGFTVGTTGIAGTIAWNGTVNIFSKMDLKTLGVTFAGVDTSGSIGLKYKDNSFLSTGTPIDLGLNAVIDRTGIKEFGVDGELSEINVPNFAKFKFTSLSASPSLENFWVSLDGTVKPQHDIFSSDVALEFEKLKISSDGIELGSMEASANISGASADLGALTLSIDRIGLGYDGSLFYISAHGGISLDIIGEANAGIKLYSDKHISVDEIAIKIEQSGLVAEGSIAWYDGDEIYGDGFKATLGLGIAQIFTADGMFRIGQKGTVFYWMANANGGIGSGVPFGPLTIYEVGGGVAYHMVYDETKKDFVPRGGAVSLMLNTTLGTSGDGGYLWNGKIKIIAGIVDGTLGQLNLTGDSWLLASRSEKPSDRQISAHITYGNSPAMMHLWVNANVKYMGITVKGSMDAIFSDAEKHVFIGTDDEYAYAFNVDKNLGHVSVGIFGIEGRGFFMVDTNAIAFGEGLYIYKHWSKDWWGPDPSLTFELTAGAKALIIYKPFQMNMDIYASVGLRGCYGGCVSIGADVLVKVAFPSPKYIWGKAGVRIFGTSMSFSGYIQGSGTLQEASDTPDIEVFDRVEVPSDGNGASRIPLIKIYSKIQKSQDAVSIRVRSVTLRKNRSNTNIPINRYALDGDWKGISIMPKAKLQKNTIYVVRGVLRANYTADGETETKDKEFMKIFTTTSSDRIAFSDIVKSITPTNGDKDVHEDKGVIVKYNAIALNILGGTSASEVQAYKIELSDADGNNIAGTFTEANANLVSKFKSNKDLRIYRYCKNEEGDVRETFVLNGVFLNPFNDFSEDDGNENEPVANELDTGNLSRNGTGMNVNSERLNAIVHQGVSIANILQSVQQNTSNNGGSINLNTREIEIRSVIPHDFHIGNITFKKPAEALGEEVMSTFSRGKSYTYYRASKYNIKVIHKVSKDVAYRSSFNIRYNNVPAESKRKVEQMSGNLEPTLTISLDMFRIGASGQSQLGMGANSGSVRNMESNLNLNPEVQRNIDMGGSHYNNGFYNEVRYEVDTSLASIGVYAGIKTKVFVTWELQNSHGSINDVREELSYSWNKGGKLLPGIVRGYKNATIQYISEVDNSVLVEIPMDLITGNTFCKACEDAEDRENRARINAAADKAKRHTGGDRMQDIENGFMEDGMDGGFSHEGGGFNPMGEGAFESMGLDAAGRQMGVGVMNGAHGANNFHGAQGAHGVDANAINVGR